MSLGLDSRGIAGRATTSVLGLALVLAGCWSDEGTSDGPPTAEAGIDTFEPDAAVDTRIEPDAPAPRPDHCNPLTLDHCLLPWPSSFYLEADTTTATGFRINYPAEALPVNKDGTGLDPTRYNRLDGFSSGSQPLAYFASGVAADGLPGVGDAAGGTGDDSLVWIYEMSSGARVPLFAEIDANAKDPDVGALIIRPLAPLKHDERHVVVLRKGLKTAAGDPLPAPEPFAKLRDGTVDEDDATLAAEAERIEPVFAFLEGQQIDLEQVVLAWDFHTASDEAVTGPLLGMIDEALAKLPADGPDYTITNVTEHPVETSEHIWFEIEAEMEVPSFLESDGADAWLNLDANGSPQYRAMQTFPFRVVIPRCAETATAPLPVLIFGHGLFGSDDTLTTDYCSQLFDRLCMVAAATNWRGMSASDKDSVATKVLTDFSNLPRVTDPLHQAHVNYQVLTELMQGKFLADDAMKIAGNAVTDGQEIYYAGVSLSGIQGFTFAALNNRIERFALNVPGGWWSQMLQRASGFFEFAAVLGMFYPSPTDVLTVIHMSQSLFDFTDPISYAHHLITEPLPGRQPKRILVQEALWDEQVPNIATRAVVRAAGLPLLNPPYESVYGIAEDDAPLQSAYVQWETDPGAMPPEGNLPPQKLEPAESPHDQARWTESSHQQIEGFLTPDGMVQQTCSGVCTVKTTP